VKNLATFFFILLLSSVSLKAQDNCCQLQPGNQVVTPDHVVVPGPQGGSYNKSVNITTQIACFNLADDFAYDHQRIAQGIGAHKGEVELLYSEGVFAAKNGRAPVQQSLATTANVAKS
jgi:hypothetical protein